MTRNIRRIAAALALEIACTGDDGGGQGDSTGSTGSTTTSASTSATTITTSTSNDGGDDSSTAAATSDATTSTTSTGTTAAESTTEAGSSSGGALDCEPGAKTGAAGNTDGVATSVGVAINVRTPADYDPTVAFPLVVVFAPAGADASLTEQFTGLTTDALARGYVIAYADHVSPQSVDVIAGLLPVIDDIVGTWCIDESRIHLTGHSDGGTIAEAMLAIDDADPRARAAAPSAAGITGTTMAQIGCPPQTSAIMVIHSTGDQLFPIADGFGHDAAVVWAGCNNCDPDPMDDGTCLTFSNCDAPVSYCETGGVHGQWTGLNTQMFDFFDALVP